MWIQGPLKVIIMDKVGWLYLIESNIDSTVSRIYWSIERTIAQTNTIWGSLKCHQKIIAPIIIMRCIVDIVVELRTTKKILLYSKCVPILFVFVLIFKTSFRSDLFRIKRGRIGIFAAYCRWTINEVQKMRRRAYQSHGATISLEMCVKNKCVLLFEERL